MNIGKLKELIKDLPDDMPVGLIDLSTDDFHDLNYKLDEGNISIEEYVTEEGGESAGEMFAISFMNKLNPNPI